MILVLIIISIIVIIIAVNNCVQQNNRLRAITISQIDEMDGYDFEYYVCQLMINQGYSASVTTASNDFGVDVIAKKNGDKYAIQVKRYSNKVSRRAVSDAVAGMNYYKCNKSMVVTNNYYTKGAYELARVNSCVLIDRSALGKWVYEYQNIKEPILKEIKSANVNKKKINKQPETNSSTKEIEVSIGSIKNDYNSSNEKFTHKNESSSIDQEILAIARKEYPRDKEMQEEEYQEQLQSKKFMANTNNKVLTSISKKEYPKDFCMQKNEYKDQLSALKYMEKAIDLEIKTLVHKEYPNDFCIQENEYKEQVYAKDYMNNVVDLVIKKMAITEYPKDYSMQEYTYKEQLQAKEYMESCPDNNKKRKAQNEYPNDYSMQEYEYRNQ